MPALGVGQYDLAVKVGEFVTPNGTCNLAALGRVSLVRGTNITLVPGTISSLRVLGLSERYAV